MLEQYGRHIPDPYPFMHLDGYTPYEILHTTSRKIYQDYRAKREAENGVHVAVETTLKDLFKDLI